MAIEVEAGTMMALCFVVGGVIAAFGFWIHMKHRKLMEECTASVVGRVKEIQSKASESRHSSGQTIYQYPVFTYSVDGREYTQTSTTGTAHQRFNVGDAVTVHYVPGIPDRYYVAEDTEHSSSGTLLMVAGGIVIVAGIIAKVMGS